jgi:hypothetical protein
MFNRQRSREVEDYAASLAREFAGRCPVAAHHQAAKTTLARAVDEVCNRAAVFQKERRLGMFQKAKFGTSFKLQLKEIGYPEDFVDTLTRQVLLTMSGK